MSREAFDDRRDIVSGIVAENILIRDRVLSDKDSRIRVFYSRKIASAASPAEVFATLSKISRLAVSIRPGCRNRTREFRTMLVLIPPG